MSKKEITSVTVDGITITSVDMESAYRLLDMDISMDTGLWNTDYGSSYRIHQLLDINLPEAAKVCILSLIYTNMYIDRYEGIIVKSIEHGIGSDAWKNLDFIVKCMKEKNLPIDVYDEDEESWETINPYNYTSPFGD